jgi:hypothetical protein
MTLDVTIGKLKGTQYIEQCPNSETDISDPKLSWYLKESYLSGSTGFWEFWLNSNLSLREIYLKMRKHPFTNDRDQAKLKPFLNDIIAIPESAFTIPDDIDRLRWLKYWAAKAVELYGDKAWISFS